MSNDLTIYQEVEEKSELIKSLYCKNLTEQETMHFFAICHKRKLNPLTNQIYVWKFGAKMTIIVSIDGLRLIAERTKKYAPGKETVFTYKKDGSLLNATAYVKKQTTDGTWHEVSATAFFDEFNDAKKDTWRKMPHVMIAKCAEAQALRKAFPEDLSGMYTKEEMDHVEENIEEAEVVSDEPKSPEKKKDITVEESARIISDSMEIPNDEILLGYIKSCQCRSVTSLSDVTKKWIEKKDKFLEYYNMWKEKKPSAL